MTKDFRDFSEFYLSITIVGCWLSYLNILPTLQPLSRRRNDTRLSLSYFHCKCPDELHSLALSVAYRYVASCNDKLETSSVYISLVRRKIHLTTHSKERLICGTEHLRGFSPILQFFLRQTFVSTVICSQYFLSVAIYLEPCIGWKILRTKITIVKYWFLFNILLHKLFFLMYFTAVFTTSRM